MENYSQDELYIPLGIKNEKEFIPGFGKNEIIQISIVLALALFGAIAYYTASKDSFGAVLGLMIIGSSAIIIIRKNENNQSVIDLLRHVITYFRSQRKYPYCYLNEWE